jgi:hypothetical protein
MNNYNEEENDENNYNIVNNGIYYRNDLLIARIVYKCLNCNHIFDTIIESLNHYKRFHQNINNSNIDNDLNVEKIDRKKSLNKTLINNNNNNKVNKIKDKLIKNKKNKNKSKELTEKSKQKSEKVVKSFGEERNEFSIFKCDFCHNCYNNTNSLSRHKRIHTNPQICDFADCRKEFSTKSQLIYHKQSHKSKANRGVKCDFCPKTYKSIDDKNRHTNIHINPKLCDYPNCGKAFPTNSDLKNHRLIHSDECPHRCQWPGCGFASKQPAG